MICVYPADCTDFSTNGNGILAPLSAEVTETLNGEYELTLVHPIDEAGKWQRLVEGCILRAPVPAAMTPRVNFTAPGDDNRTEVWKVHTDFSGAETRKGTLNLRSGPGRNYKILAAYGDVTDTVIPEPTKPAEPESPLGTRLLKRTSPYMRGDDVKALQSMLNVLGFNCGAVDGIFGDKTKAGVKAFQQAKGLVVDGIVGPMTRAALLAA